MDLSQATDELLAAPWEGFVETRGKLADELARAGKRDDSRALKKIRRPTASAWATNQVVRRARPAVDRYLAASDELRARQAALVGGGGDRAAYQPAAEAFRQATAALTQAVRKVLEHGGRDPDRAQIEGVMANVRAGALADDRRAELLAGRLLGDLATGEAGLETVFGASLAASAAATAPVVRQPHHPVAAHQAPRAHEGAHGKGESDAHTKREAEARARREAHARQVAAAAADEAAAREAAAAATTEADHARATRDRAEQRLKDAEAALAEARAAVHEAKTALHAAERTEKERRSAAERASEQRQSLEKHAPR